MGMHLRPYQTTVKEEIYKAWDKMGVQNVLAVLPTGAGKTVTFSDVMHEHKGECVAVAHRQELVSQISVALAREGVKHKIIAPKKIIKFCVGLHIKEVGRSLYDPNAGAAVAGVDTLIRRDDAAFLRWAERVTLWVMDEAHHVLAENKWGKAIDMFPNAKGLGVTATPCRADGSGLGSHADGDMDVMVEGPTMRELINMGYLTDYRIIAPTTANLDLSQVPVGASGEYVKKSLSKAVAKSQLVGDVVENYLKFSKGKRGVTFATDLDNAQKICDEFLAAGVPALMVHGGSSDTERTEATAKLGTGEIHMLVNVDLFGEGFDLPSISTVIMARPTKSFSLYVQQFGRALRLLIDPALRPHWDSFTDEERRAHIAASSKPYAIIIDHVGNFDLLAGGHGLPDAPQNWTLDRREKRGGGGQAADDVIPTRGCLNPECQGVYERTYVMCPFCGTAPKRALRSGPEHVDGDLTEISAEKLAEMRGEVATLRKTPEEYAEGLRTTNPVWKASTVKKYSEKHKKNMLYQEALAASIAWWAGIQRHKGQEDREIMRRFYYTFGVDALRAQALEAADALMLADKINKRLGVEYADI